MPRLKKNANTKKSYSQAGINILCYSGYEFSLKLTSTVEKFMLKTFFIPKENALIGLASVGWLDSTDTLLRVMLRNPLEGINNLNDAALIKKDYVTIANNYQKAIILIRAPRH